MSTSAGEVERIARLAGLALDPESLPALAGQIRQILDYVSQLEGVEHSARADQEYPGPRQSLRDDEPRRTPLAVPLDQLAPAFREGLFLVPRVEGTGGPEAASTERDGK